MGFTVSAGATSSFFGSTAIATGAPHLPQNLALSLSFAPHFLQNMVRPP